MWNELAEKFKDAENLTIAKMDATANDVPDSAFDVKGFPTLYFVEASGTISKYEGGRTLEALSTYVEEKAGVKAESSTEAPKEEADKKDEL